MLGASGKLERGALVLLGKSQVSSSVTKLLAYFQCLGFANSLFPKPLVVEISVEKSRPHLQ